MQELSGSSFLYCLFVTSNALLFSVGLGTALAGTFICASLHSADWYSLSFIILGFVTTLVSFWGFRMRHSMSALSCYLFFTAVFLVFQFCLTIAIIFYGRFQDRLGSLSANLVRYSLLGACGVIAFSLYCGWWYRSSLQTVRFYYENYELMKEPEQPQLKPSKAREEMEKKYPKLREMGQHA